MEAADNKEIPATSSVEAEIVQKVDQEKPAASSSVENNKGDHEKTEVAAAFDIDEQKLDESAEEQDPMDYSVNLMDVVKEQEETELEAMAVLGGSDENNCTYSKGYIKRQALYSCLTCIPESRDDPEKRAGICLACSLTCHEQHELIELYTKRHFRCDCGGAKMKAIRCKLEPIKFGLNEENIYNQNFSGLYCTCNRPYPDPEDKIVDEMIQCVVCEDWYHGRHLNTNVPKDFSEMICGNCIDKNDFLTCYFENAMMEQSKDETLDVEIVEGQSNKRPLSDEAQNSTEPKKVKLDTDGCKKPEKQNHPKQTAVFWLDGWREKLCTCKTCQEIYGINKVEFLIDPEDSVQKYEEIGIQRTRGSTSEEREMQALSTLNRTQQVDIITEYNRFRDRLKEYLHAFAVNGQTVTEEDVNRFFTMMKSEKAEKQGLPYFCR